MATVHKQKCAILPDMWHIAQPVDGRTIWIEEKTVITAMEYLPYQLIQNFVTNGVHILSQILSSPTVLIGEKISTFGGIPPAQPNSNPEGPTFQTRKGIKSTVHMWIRRKKKYLPNQISKKKMSKKHPPKTVKLKQQKMVLALQLFSKAPASP